MQSEGKAWAVGANDTGSITNERSIEQEEENIPHSPSKEEASRFVAGKEEINPAAKKEDNCIVIDDSQSGKSEWPTSWIPSLNMTQSDKAILKSSNAWLSDSIINAAQLLLKRRNALVGGLQNVNFGLTNSFEVETGEFVQIIHTGEGHWHVVSTIGTQYPDVNVFDSIYCHCPEHSKLQISNLLMTKKNTIRLQYNNVQMQSGQADCGLFAIAFATALLNGLHPGVYYFDQSLMRSHLLNCFERGEIETFPTIKERRVKNKIKRIEEFNVYCSCRRPLTRGAHLIQCGACREWYHTDSCVKIDKTFINTKKKWLCYLCKC